MEMKCEKFPYQRESRQKHDTAFLGTTAMVWYCLMRKSMLSINLSYNEYFIFTWFYESKCYTLRYVKYFNMRQLWVHFVHHLIYTYATLAVNQTKHKIVYLELEIAGRGRNYFLVFRSFKYEEIKIWRGQVHGLKSLPHLW